METVKQYWSEINEFFESITPTVGMSYFSVLINRACQEGAGEDPLPYSLHSDGSRCHLVPCVLLLYQKVLLLQALLVLLRSH